MYDHNPEHRSEHHADHPERPRRRREFGRVPHHHPDSPGPHGHRGGRRGRAQRGDVRTATLLLLSEQPMHGYQLMQAIAERSNGAWRPSPGAVYPTIAQLEDEGLVRIAADGGRKLVTLTDAGRAHLNEHAATLGDPFAVPVARTAAGTDLREALEEIHIAARQVARMGSDVQLRAAREALAEARRMLYLILADDPRALATIPSEDSIGGQLADPTDTDPADADPADTDPTDERTSA